MRNQRLDMDAYLSYIGKTEEEWREQLKPQAEQRLHRFLVLRKLAQEEGIDVNPEELQAEIDTMITDSGESQDAIRQAFASDSARDSFRYSLIGRKVMQRLVEIIEGRSESAEPSGELDSIEPDPVEDKADEEPEPEAD